MTSLPHPVQAAERGARLVKVAWECVELLYLLAVNSTFQLLGLLSGSRF